MQGDILVGSCGRTFKECLKHGGPDYLDDLCLTCVVTEYMEEITSQEDYDE
jgi:hypothetical protein